MANLLRRLAMALFVVAVVPVKRGSGPGVARADDYTGWCSPYLNEGDSMSEGSILGGDSPCIENKYGLHLQHDCNMVLYPHGQFDKQLWASNTAGRAQHCTLIMQNDCNCVLYETGTQNVLWASGTNGLATGCWIEVQLDGNVVVYGAGRVALWATGTVQ